MKVLVVASEAVPFIKTGGLADVIGSLPKALQKKEIEIRVVLPKYGTIPEEFQKKMALKHTSTINVGWRKQYCGLLHLEYDGIIYYFIDNEFYFKRDRVYGYLDDFDEAERFTFFSRSILEMLPGMDFQPDIIHLHDWQTAMIPLFLEADYRKQDYYQNIKTVFTIHNLKYQGIFQKEAFDDLIDVDEKHFTMDGVEYYGKVNMMKAGLNYAQLITTVSKTYADEIKYPFFGEGLDSILRKRDQDLYGIVNGIDTSSYNPETDPALSHNYSIKSMENKQKNKEELQQILKLPQKQNIPIISIISRLVSQKGLDLVIHILEDLLQESLQLVVLGTGDDKYETILSDTAKKYPNKVSVQFRFDEALSRKIYAGSDLFLMPSLYEPCGISQQIAMRYLTVPIVRETGGLKDTVLPYNEFSNDGYGFTFANYNAHDMLFTIRRAIKFYQNKEVWVNLQHQMSQRELSWNKSAEEYYKLYSRLLKT